MKIKQSFVTNSSTTSFVMFAFSKTIKEITSNEILMNSIKDKFDADEQEDHLYNLSSAISTYLHEKNSRLNCEIMHYDDDYLYFGIHPNKIGLDETRRDVLIGLSNDSNTLLNFFVNIEDFTYFEEAWMDG